MRSIGHAGIPIPLESRVVRAAGKVNRRRRPPTRPSSSSGSIERGLRRRRLRADVGQNDDMAAVEAKAVATGASKVYIEDLKDELVADYVFAAVKANAIYEGRYLLGTSLARPLIAKRQIEIAHKEKARYVAHGATGKGNDQVRFELELSGHRPLHHRSSRRGRTRISWPPSRAAPTSSPTRPPTASTSRPRRRSRIPRTPTSSTSATNRASSRTPGRRRPRRSFHGREAPGTRPTPKPAWRSISRTAPRSGSPT